MYTTIFLILFLLVSIFYIGLYIYTILTGKIIFLHKMLHYSPKIVIGLVILLILSLVLNGTIFTGVITNYF